MRREGRLFVIALLAGLCPPPAGAAVTTYQSSISFLEAAGPLHLEDFEQAPLVGDVNGGGVAMLSFDGFRAEADPASLKLLDTPDAGNHSVSTFGPRYLTADTESLRFSAEVTLTFEPPIDRLGLFLVDLDSFDMGVTINGATYVVPSTGDGQSGYFGILSDTPFSEVVLDSLGSENHFSLDDLSFPSPPAPEPAGAVPDGTLFLPGIPLQISHAAGGDLLLSWSPSCRPTDTDFEIYEGLLGDFTTHLPLACSTGGAATAVLTPPPGSAYYLVVPRNLTREGSYGRASGGAARPRPASACLPQEALLLCN